MSKIDSVITSARSLGREVLQSRAGFDWYVACSLRAALQVETGPRGLWNELRDYGLVVRTSFMSFSDRAYGRRKGIEQHWDSFDTQSVILRRYVGRFFSRMCPKRSSPPSAVMRS